MGPSKSSAPAGERAPEETLRATVRPAWILLALVMLLASTVLAWLQPPHPVPAKTNRTLLEWWRYPIERHAGLRLPSMPAGLVSIEFDADGQRGWAVGVGGTIVATRDAGKTWEAQRVDTGRTFGKIKCLSLLRCWAFGNGGVVASTTDGGAHWRVDQLETASDLRAVSVQGDGKNIWAAGNQGAIARSVDGGTSYVVEQPVQGDISGLHFAQDALHGWMASSAGIQRTENGGGSWVPSVTSGLVGTREFNAITMLADNLKGWAVGSGGAVVATTDGGKTWRAQESGVGTALLDVRATDDGRFVTAVGLHGTFLSSLDGGVSWRKGGSDLPYDFHEIHVNPDGRRLWVVGGGGMVMSSTDAGQSWVQHSSVSGKMVWSLWWQPGSTQVWAAGDDGLLLHSKDEGARWVVQDSGTRVRLRGLGFSNDGRHGVAVGSAGTVITTSDGGRNWRKHEVQSTRDLTQVHVDGNGQRAWIPVGSGLVLTRQAADGEWSLLGDWTTGEFTAGVAFQSDGLRGVSIGEKGTILATANGGATWPITQPTPDRLNALSLVQAATVWAVGENGAIWHSTDSTQFQSRKSEARLGLNDVKFSADGRLGWIVGDAGTALYSSDSGVNWSKMETATGGVLLAVAMDETGQKAWIGGYPPGLLRTTDAGRTWAPIPNWPVQYQRYPAPWYYLALLLICLPLWLAFRPKRELSMRGAEAMGANDAPTENFTQDRLQFGPLARGISRFLRNARTEPPLTIAVSGEWGSGKSSLMSLVCADLRRYGSRPVWFNAWHHQNEEQLLASLLSAIRDRGLPPLWTLDGMAFRLRLLWLRSRKHFVWVLIVLVAVSVVSAYLWSHNTAEWTQLWGQLTKWLPILKAVGEGSPEQLSALDAGKLLSQVVAGATALVALGKALKAFGSDPAVLLASAAANFTMKDASAQTSFRSKFAEQFSEVTEALPYRMVIVIDDLDRCRPETVLNVMESVNFLVSSGRCIVMFGMATQRVCAALGLAFEKIAKELVELDVALPDAASADVKEKAERARRHAYARNYLEKLINLEVAVPLRADMDAFGLLERPSEDQVTAMRSLGGQALSLWPLWGACCAIAFGMAVGLHITFKDEVVGTKAPLVSPKSSLADPVANASTVKLAPPQSMASDYAPLHRPEVQGGDERPTHWTPLLAGLLLFTAGVGGLLIYRVRTGMRHVEDSADFDAALHVWLPVVQQRRATPRAIKRFGNRLRYLAMLQQSESLDHSLWDEMRAMWRARMQGKRAATAPRRGQVVQEHTLVALGALYEAYADQWRERVHYQDPSPGGAAMQQRVGNAINEYTARTGQRWPPPQSELDAFERTLKGVRLAGDRGDATRAAAAPA